MMFKFPIFTISCTFLLLFLITGCEKNVDQDAEDKQNILKYVEKSQISAQSTESGIYYVIEEPGIGEKPLITSVVKVHYTGKLLNGTVFDSSYTSGNPIEVGMQEVILGWQEGIRLFARGGKGTLIMPSRYGYGNYGVGSIPPNSVLVFNIHLIDFH